MTDAPAQLRHDLPAGSLWVCEPAPDSIQCTRGTLWITQTGNPDDILLEPGGHFAPATSGKIIVQALTRAGFTVQAKPPHPFVAPARRTRVPLGCS